MSKTAQSASASIFATTILPSIRSNPAISAIVLVTLFYLSIYFLIGDAPGLDANNPLGWFSSYDQALYLKSTLAFANGDLSPEAHLYPPLYPFLGAILYPLLGIHSFLVVNLVLICAFTWLNLQLLARYVGPFPAAALTVAGLLMYHNIALHWAAPWTSTLSAVFLLAAFYLLDRFIREQKNPTWSQRAYLVNAALFGGAIGLLAPTRPGELLTVAPVALTYAGLTIQHLAKNRRAYKNHVTTILGGAAGFAIPITALIAYNGAVYGEIGSLAYGGAGAAYSELVSFNGGFWIGDIGEKLFSQLIASHVYYVDGGNAWLNVIPLALAAALFLPVTLFAGPLIFRVFAAAAILHFGAVYAFADALPTGTFEMFNIHYFKWLMPLMFAVAYWHLHRAYKAHGRKRTRAIRAVCTAAIIGIGALSLTATYHPTPARATASTDTVTVTIDNKAGRQIDFIDIEGVYSSWRDLYFARKSALVADGDRPMRMMRDFRLIRRGNGMRILFIRPVSVTSIELINRDDIVFVNEGEIKAHAIDVRFRPGVPFYQPDAPAVE